MNKYFVYDRDGTLRAAQTTLSGACNYATGERVIIVSTPEECQKDFAKADLDAAQERTDYLVSMNWIIKNIA